MAQMRRKVARVLDASLGSAESSLAAVAVACAAWLLATRAAGC